MGYSKGDSVLFWEDGSIVRHLQFFVYDYDCCGRVFCVFGFWVGFLFLGFAQVLVASCLVLKSLVLSGFDLLGFSHEILLSDRFILRITEKSSGRGCKTVREKSDSNYHCRFYTSSSGTEFSAGGFASPSV